MLCVNNLASRSDKNILNKMSMWRKHDINYYELSCFLYKSDKNVLQKYLYDENMMKTVMKYYI